MSADKLLPWKGPWKCEKCGYRYVAGVPGGRCRCGEDEETRCTGTLIPHDRRAPAPSADVRSALEWCLPYVEQARLLMALTEEGRKDLQEEIDEARSTLSQPAPSADGLRADLRKRIRRELDEMFDGERGEAEATDRIMDLFAALPAPQEARGEMRGVMTSVTELLDEDVRRELAIDETSGLQLAVVRICNLLQATWNASRAHPAPGLRERVEEVLTRWLGKGWGTWSKPGDDKLGLLHSFAREIIACLTSSPSDDAAAVERVAKYIYDSNTYDDHGPSMHYATDQARRILAIVKGEGA